MNRIGWIVVLMVALAARAALAATEPNLQDLLLEVQRRTIDKQQMLVVWWIPVEYWQTVFRDQPGLTEDQKTQVYQTLDEYLLLCVADATVTAADELKPKSRGEILKELSVTLPNGTQLTLLPDAQVSMEAKALVAAMKPTIVNTAGKVGEGMEFVFFKGKDAQGNRIADPRKDGGFVVQLGNEAFRWRLPLGSLLPPKFDQATGEKFPGNYQFSPFTGKKLSDSAKP